MRTRGVRVSARVAVVVAAGLAVAAPGGGLAATLTLEVLSTEADPDSTAALERAFARFQTTHRDVRVEARFLDREPLGKRLVASVAAGAPPAVALQDDAQVQFLLAQNVLAPVDELLDRLGRADLLPRALDAFRREGKTYGVPSAVSYTLLWYRADLYDRYGLKPPVTWADLLANARAVTTRSREEGSVVHGMGLPLTVGRVCHDELFHSLVWGNGAAIFGPQGQVTFDQPAIVQALEFVRALREWAPPDTAADGALDPLRAFVAGKTAHLLDDGRLLASLQRQAPDLLERTDAVLMPRGPRPLGRHVSYNRVKAWVIPKQARERVQFASELITMLETREEGVPRRLHAPPLHLVPRGPAAGSKDVAESSLARTRAGRAALRLAEEATARHGVLAGDEAGGRGPSVPRVIEAGIPCRAVHEVAVLGVSAAEAVGRGQQAVERLVAP